MAEPHSGPDKGPAVAASSSSSKTEVNEDMETLNGQKNKENGAMVSKNSASSNAATQRGVSARREAT